MTMRQYVVLLSALSFACVAATRAEVPGSPIFVSGKEGYDCFRIPGMVALANNVLLAFAEGRKYSCADHDWNDIVMKRSVDGGKTWAPLVVIISESSPSDHVTDGNPAPVALTNGSVLLPYCRNNLEVFITRSDDGGVTWTPSHNLTGIVTEPDWSWIATGPPGSLELPSGDIIFPADHITTGGASGSHTFRYDPSTDAWSIGELLTIGNECQAARLANGSIMLGMRSRAADQRLFAVSNDEGASFLPGYGQASLPDPHCEGSLISPPSGDTLYQSNAFSTSSRSNMTVSVSHDQGASWSVLANVYAGPSAYSSMAILNSTSTSRTIALAWEAGVLSPYEQIAFVSIADSGAA